MKFIERLLARLPWEHGRQGSGYNKLKLAESRRFKFDCYLLYFPTGSYIDEHRDGVAYGWRHYRLNIMLKRAERGGEFKCENPIFTKFRINLFRPDIRFHSVTQIHEGYRVMLSIGWLRAND